MNIIICIEKNKGISFNNRRLSKDKKIIDDIVKNYDVVGNKYTQAMFEEYGLTIKEKKIKNATKKDLYYFIEDDSINSIDCINNLIIYDFNRNYPSDVKLIINLENFILIEEFKIEGTSHKEIIKKVYRSK